MTLKRIQEIKLLLNSLEEEITQAVKSGGAELATLLNSALIDFPRPCSNIITVIEDSALKDEEVSFVKDVILPPVAHSALEFAHTFSRNGVVLESKTQKLTPPPNLFKEGENNAALSRQFDISKVVEKVK